MHSTKDTDSMSDAGTASGEQAGHSPGPWTMRHARHGKDADIAIISDEGGIIAEVFERGGSAYAKIAPVAANARLIAAAPSLLDFLKNWLPIIDDTAAGVSYKASLFEGMARDMRVVIAKAEGKD